MLHRSLRRNDLRALLEASPVAIVELDRRGVVRQWNSAAEALTGWSAEEVIGRRVPPELVEVDPGSFSRLLEHLDTAPTAPTLHVSWRHRLGRVIEVEFSPTPLYDRAGKIRAVMGLCVDVTEREQLERRLRYQAQHDSLTNLPNRGMLLGGLEEALRTGAEGGTKTGLLMIDLDKFKEVNDSLGHALGDQLLAQIGPRLLSGVVRANDMVARLSGDEFAVLLPDVPDVAAVADVAERVLAALHAPFHLDGVSADVAASIGVAVAPDHGEEATELLHLADTAMYEAKETAAGVVVYQTKRAGQTPSRFGLLGELRRALERDELVVYFQPKVDLTTGSVCGAEALVRWEHPERGLVPPGDFIPVVESTGLMGRLTDHVLDVSLAQARAWADAGHPIPVSVNVSARGLHDETLPRRVAAALERHGVAPDLLCLEITEGAVMYDPEKSLAALKEFAEAGVHLSLDDFGTGYSSMAYLQRLPVSELKIDRSFVTGLDRGQADAVLVRSAIDMSHGLNLTVVAEGVEDAEVLTALNGLGCDAAQGYYLARPMPAETFAAWLADAGTVDSPDQLAPTALSAHAG